MMSRCFKAYFLPWCVSSSYYEPLLQARSFSSVPPRRTPTRDILDRLKSVKNVRDLSEACPHIAPGKIYRSACPVSASPEDIQEFRQSLQIRCLLDLRSDYERQYDKPNSAGLLSHAKVRSFQRGRKGALAVKEHLESNSPDMVISRCSLLERDRYYRAMITKLPYRTTANILFWRLFNEHHAKILAIREINRAGLPGLYETILETSGIEIKQALEILTDAAENEESAVFFCKVGKDRTGLIAAMVLTCCNASTDEIISDYIRSDGIDQIALGSMEKDKELAELDTAMFSRAPAEAMRLTIDYLCNQYGSVRGYLDSLGFGREQQNRLAAALSPPSNNSA